MDKKRFVVLMAEDNEHDIVATRRAWKQNNIANPLYIVRDGGTVSCIDTGTGKIIYREKTGARGQYTASPIIANDHLFFTSARGVVTVVKAGDDFTIVHQEDLDVPVNATPAMDENTLYIRTKSGLMAFRE